MKTINGPVAHHAIRRHKHQRRSRSFLLVGGVAVTALVAAACGSASSDTSEGGSEDGISMVVSEAPEIIDPCQTAKSSNGRILRGNITEALTTLNPETAEAEPRLATEWTETSPTTWQFTLQEGVKFHNGDDFNADAVVAWMERVLNADADCYVLGFILPEVKGVEAVEAVEPNVVEFTLGRPDPIFPKRMSLVDISIAPEDPTTVISEPIGTGPYTFDSYEQGQKFLSVRNDDYWGEEPSIASVEYLFRAESGVRAAMAQAGEVDMATEIGPQDSDMEGAVTYTVSETAYFRFDALTPPLDDLRVRKAINHAIDREKFIETVWAGNGEPASELFLPSIAGANPEVQWEYDPELARDLIAEARADGVPVDEEIEVIQEVSTRGSNGSELMDTLAAMLNDVGLNAKGIAVEEAVRSDRLSGTPVSPDYAPALVGSYHGNSVGDASQTYLAKVFCDADESVLCDSTVDDMIEAALAASGDERASLFGDVGTYLAENVVPHVPLAYTTDTIVLVNDRLQFEPTAASFEAIEIADMTLD